MFSSLLLSYTNFFPKYHHSHQQWISYLKSIVWTLEFVFKGALKNISEAKVFLIFFFFLLCTFHTFTLCLILPLHFEKNIPAALNLELFTLSDQLVTVWQTIFKNKNQIHINFYPSFNIEIFFVFFFLSLVSRSLYRTENWFSTSHI